MLSRVLAAIALLAAPAVASATTLIDGSFEAKGAATPVTNYCYDGFATPGGPACAASPWTGNGVIHTGSGAWGGPIAPDGTYLAFVQGNGVLAQTFTATATSTLGVTWFDADRTAYGTKSYTVSITSGALTTLLGTYTTSSTPFVAQTSAPFLVAAGQSYTLSFTGLGTEDRTAFIDDVALTAVPEPTTWAMLFAGFGLVGFALRRHGSTTVAA